MLPRNSGWVSIEGMVGPTLGVVHLSLDPPPPGPPNADFSVSISTQKPYDFFDTLWAIPLNPNAHYNMTVWTEADTVRGGVHLSRTTVIPYDNA